MHGPIRVAVVVVVVVFNLTPFRPRGMKRVFVDFKRLYT